MLNYIYTIIQHMPIFIMSAFSSALNYSWADKTVDQERKDLESRATEEIINHKINYNIDIDQIRLRGF